MCEEIMIQHGLVMSGKSSNKNYAFRNEVQGLEISGLESLETNKIDKPVLIIQRVNKQPPHVAMGYKGLYFSLTVKGSEVEVDLETRIQNLRKLKVPTVFFFLNEPKSASSIQEVSELFNTYKPLQMGETCLAPVLDFFRAAYQLKPTKELVFGLLDELNAQNLIHSVFYIQLEEFLLKDHAFLLNHYTTETVQQRIEMLLKKSKHRQDRN
jgi:hypothetical protein